MSRLKDTFNKNNILSIYYTAGYPKLNDTLSIAVALENAGVDMIEIGFPYSDPVADGPVIQESSGTALHNGMTVSTLFEQLKDLRNEVKIPVILMGYFNPVFQYGVEPFLKKCKEIGVDGLIIPDLPLSEYQTLYKPVFVQYGISMIFLITPETTDNRIAQIDEESSSFIYAVSSSSITGKNIEMTDSRVAYFDKLKQLKTQHPVILGFGITDKASFKQACNYTKGGIIGTAFIEFVKKNGITSLNKFVNGIIEV